MKRLALSVLVALFFVGVFFRSPEAHALGPVNLEVGARVGYATNPNSDYDNPFGAGLGVRGGVELFKSLYVGGNVMYYLGTSHDTTLSGGNTTDSVSTHALLLGLEVGYSLHVSMLTIRPQLGFGDVGLTTFSQFNGTTNTTLPIGNFTVTNQLFYLEPGLVGLVNVGPVYFGGDVNLLVVPGADQSGVQNDTHTLTSFAFGGQLGIRL